MVAAFCQEPAVFSYAAASIPEELKKEAKAVYRLDEAVLDIVSSSKYTLKVHQIITILNAEGAAHLQQSLGIDKFNKVTEIEVRLYNAVGMEMQRYKKKDFAVQSYYDGMSLATDDKIMHLSLAATAYPCTVDVNYLLDVTGYIDLPNWYMNNSSSSIEQFRYIVKAPINTSIRYRTVNLNVNPVIQDNGKQKVYTWETKNVAINKLEAGGYEGSKYLPQVAVSPNQFEYDGYKGDFSNWKNFGNWTYALYEEKNPFSEQRAAEIKAMVTGNNDVATKVRVLYNYLQKNMRYVSIQFGIGGFKPFSTRFVDEKKYGDCKALTNYMRNLLAVVGIKSYPALINAGYNKVPASPDFPENIFNHVILCVPGTKDSIWLECTSTNNESGFLGSFTENKNALLLTENGGFLVPTPKSNYNKNILATVSDIFLDENGGAEINSQISAAGGYYQLLYQIGNMEKSRQSELFIKYLDYKEPDAFNLVENKEFSLQKPLKLKSTYSKLFDFKAGDQFFFPTAINKLCDEKLAFSSHRKSDYVFDFPYTKSDTTIFHLPPSFKTGDLPKDKEIAKEPVYYKRKIMVDKDSNTIKIISTFMLKSNVISADNYKDVCLAIKEVEKEEEEKLILQK